MGTGSWLRNPSQRFCHARIPPTGRATPAEVMGVKSVVQLTEIDWNLIKKAADSEWRIVKVFCCGFLIYPLAERWETLRPRIHGTFILNWNLWFARALRELPDFDVSSLFSCLPRDTFEANHILTISGLWCVNSIWITRDLMYCQGFAAVHVVDWSIISRDGCVF